VTFNVLNIQLDTGTPTGKLMLTCWVPLQPLSVRWCLSARLKGVVRREKDEADSNG